MKNNNFYNDNFIGEDKLIDKNFKSYDDDNQKLNYDNLNYIDEEDDLFIEDDLLDDDLLDDDLLDDDLLDDDLNPNILEEQEFVFLEEDDDKLLKSNKDLLNIDKLEDDYEGNFLTEEEKNKYVEENINIVYAVAQQHTSYYHSKEELIGVGFKGFTKALNTFDKNRNVKFSTYAWTCVRFDILHYTRKEKKHQGNMSIETVLNVDESGNNMELGDILKDTDFGARTNDETVIINEALELLKKTIEELPEEEQYILKHLHGLNGAEIKTQEEIANELGMSQPNVSKIKINLLSKLKKLLEIKYGLDNLNDIKNF